MQTRSLLVVVLATFAIGACSKSSDSQPSAAASASAVPVWPVLPADPVDANTPAEDDPATQAYARIASAVLRGDFHKCIEHELPKNSKLAGSVVMIATIKADGTVASVQQTELEGFDAPSMKCLTTAISAKKFPAPPKGDSLVKLPFVLKSQ